MTIGLEVRGVVEDGVAPGTVGAGRTVETWDGWPFRTLDSDVGCADDPTLSMDVIVARLEEAEVRKAVCSGGSGLKVLICESC